LLLLLPLFLLPLLGGCGPSTRVASEWRQHSFVGQRFESIMVVGIARRDEVRWRFESQLAAELAERGVRAVASSKVLAPSEAKSREAIAAAVERLDIEAVLVTRMVRVDTQEEHVDVPPPRQPDSYHQALYDYYFASAGEVQAPGYTIENQVVMLETALFESGQGAMVWQVYSQTFDPKSVDTIIGDLRDLLVDRLEGQELI
jgi:hypothetical protein